MTDLVRETLAFNHAHHMNPVDCFTLNSVTKEGRIETFRLGEVKTFYAFLQNLRHHVEKHWPRQAFSICTYYVHVLPGLAFVIDHQRTARLTAPLIGKVYLQKFKVQTEEKNSFKKDLLNSVALDCSFER